MRCKPKDVLDHQILKPRKFAKENQEFFFTIPCQLPALLWPGYMTLLTPSTQVCETVFVVCSLPAATHRVHIWAQSASQSCWSAPKVCCQLYSGCLAGSSEALVWYRHKQSQCIHRRVTQQPHSTYCFLFLLYRAGYFSYFSSKEYPLDTNSQHQVLDPKHGLIRPGFALKISV